MTAAIVHPSPDLWDDAQDALNRHRAAGTRDEAAYWIGVNVGILAALIDSCLYWDQLTAARARHFAIAAPVDGLRHLSMLPPTDHNQQRIEAIYRASGVLYGWKQATAELPDADECTACEARVLLEHDPDKIQCRLHGTMCDIDCARAVCTPLCERQDWW